MKKFLPPLCLTLDNTFKAFFKHDQDLLKPLLQDFLPLPPGCRVEHVQLLDAEENSSEASKPSGKTFILDMKLRISRQLSSGEWVEDETVNVEMQTVSQRDLTNRLLAYAGRVYSNQVKEGEKYEKLRTVYSLVFSTVDLPELRKDNDYYHTCSMRQDRHPHLRLTDGMQFVIVELNKFIGRLDSLVDQREAWCYFLKRSDELNQQTSQELAKKGRDMGRAVKNLWNLSQDELMRERLEAEDKQRRDRLSQIDTAHEEGLEKGLERGREKGREEGLEKGLERGREEGLEKGRRKEREAIALKMILKGQEALEIAEATGLSEDEIKALPKK